MSLAENRVRLKFLGAIGTVTGSCTVLEYTAISGEKTYYMIDIGEYQGEHTPDIPENKRRALLWAKKIKGLFITHAHLDHIGLLPDFIKAGFTGTVYCTTATHDLIKIMMADAAKIKKENPPDFEKIRFSMPDEKDTFEFRYSIPLAYDFFIGILRSSHILGSCTWSFQWAKKDYPENIDPKEKDWFYIFFSGDVGPVDKSCLPNLLFRGRQMSYATPTNNRFIILESTYGNRPPREKGTREKTVFDKRIERLVEIIEKHGTNILIPAFALNRSQEILLDLHYLKYARKVPFYQKERLVKNKSKFKISLRNENPEKWKALTEVCQKYNINTELSPDFPYHEMPDEMLDEILSIDNRYDKENIYQPPGYIRIAIESSLIEEINKIYLEHLADRFYSTKKDDLCYEYKYISQYFLTRFGLGEENASPEQIRAVESIVREAFLIKESTPQQNTKKQNAAPQGNSITVSASGMCDEGKIVTLLPHFLRNEQAAILLTGYQASDTNGSRLRKLSRGEYTEDEKFDQKIVLPSGDIRLSDVKCKIFDLSAFYSGHADQEQLVNYVVWDNDKHPDMVQPTVFLNHGTDEARRGLKEAIEARDHQRLEKAGTDPKPISVILSEINRWYNLNNNGEAEDEPDELEETAVSMINEDTVITLSFSPGDIRITLPPKYEEKLPEISRFFRERIISNDGDEI